MLSLYPLPLSTDGRYRGLSAARARTLVGHRRVHICCVVIVNNKAKCNYRGDVAPVCTESLENACPGFPRIDLECSVNGNGRLDVYRQPMLLAEL